MLCGLLASLLESVGDYYACARMSGAPPPPRHAMDRGIGAEGVGCLLAGAFGCGIDTTAYGENIGAIGITKVKSNFSLFSTFLQILEYCLRNMISLQLRVRSTGERLGHSPTP